MELCRQEFIQAKISVKGKHRLSWIDAGKGLGLLMVVFDHVDMCTDYSFLPLAFHLPLFFVLAGYTFNVQSDTKTFLWKKTKSLMIPYVSLAIIWFVAKGIIEYSLGNEYLYKSEIGAFIYQRRYTPLWFLTALYVAELAAYMMLKFMRNKGISQISVMILLLVVLQYAFVRYGIINCVWNIDLAPIIAAFVLCGYLYRNHLCNRLPEGNTLFLLAISVSAVIIITFNYLNFNIVEIFLNSYGFMPMYFVGALLASYAVILFFKRVEAPDWLLYIGEYSLIFFGLHGIITNYLPHIYRQLNIVYDGQSMISLCVAMVAMIFICLTLLPINLLINKKMPWALGKF